MNKLISKINIKEANDIVFESMDCINTPMLKDIQKMGFLPEQDGLRVHLKLENMQLTGSFKSRGIVMQMHKSQFNTSKELSSLVTMSAGNYGKAFSIACEKRGIKGTVVMPDTAPQSRVNLIKKHQCEVIQCPISQVMDNVNGLVECENMQFFHSFDDINLIAGYGSIGFEILEKVSPDVVIVGCGGGGLLSGVSASLKLFGTSNMKAYGVEPETANSMQRSIQQKHAVQMHSSHSIASGLSPPMAGTLCYEHVAHFVDDVITLSDVEIVRATKFLFDRGLAVEPAGAASFAALMFNKIPDLQGDVVAIVTGGNSTASELVDMFDKFLV